METNYFLYGIKNLFVFHFRAIAVILCLSSINSQAGRLDDIEDQLSDMEFQQEMREIRRLNEERNRQAYSQQESPQVNKFNPKDIWLKGYTQIFNNGSYTIHVNDAELRALQDFDSYTKEKPKHVLYFIEFLQTQPPPPESNAKFFKYANGQLYIYCRSNMGRNIGGQILFNEKFRGVGYVNLTFKYENIKDDQLFMKFLPYVCR